MYTGTGETTHEATARGRAAIVAIGPLLLLGALLWHPPLPGRLPDSNAVADAAAADITRWDCPTSRWRSRRQWSCSPSSRSAATCVTAATAR